MRYGLSTLIAALAVWTTLTLALGKRSGREEPQRAIAVREPVAPIPTRAPTHARTVAPSPDPVEALKAKDAWTASNLRQGMDLGLERLVRSAHAAHAKDPSECAPALELTPTVAHVESSMEKVAISIRVREEADLASPARGCLNEYFAGVVEVGDDEIGGPFPEVTFDADYPLPMKLSEYLRRPVPGAAR